MAVRRRRPSRWQIRVVRVGLLRSGQSIIPIKEFMTAKLPKLQVREAWSRLPWSCNFPIERRKLLTHVPRAFDKP